MNQKELPHSPPAERNKGPILEILEMYLRRGKVLEMGFGTAQHAQHFTKHFPWVTWYCADHEDQHWILEEKKKLDPQWKVEGPIDLFVSENRTMYEQVQDTFDFVYTANTMHIMSENEVRLFCEQVGQLIYPNGVLIIYGPFKYEGEYTSASNITFDLWLKQKYPGGGIKDFEIIHDLLAFHGFEFLKLHKMPANNEIISFRKLSQ
jgi:hypothetical protein